MKLSSSEDIASERPYGSRRRCEREILLYSNFFRQICVAKIGGGTVAILSVLGQQSFNKDVRSDFSVGQSAERDGNLHESCRARAKSPTGKDESKTWENFVDRALRYAIL